ncbi:MAG TPA: hypothetical protein VGS06_42110 [Streptosporangiaceae bacterium]|nr:hypothetical protein [Streptosporangiaceae bacterium]
MAGTSSPVGRGRQGRRRARQPVPRTQVVEFKLTGEEYTILAEAARRAGMARRAYAAQAVLAAAANGTTVSGQDPMELLLIELMRAAGLVRRIATNINQAAAKLNTVGQPTGDLPRYAADSLRRADNIDAVADAVRKALR